MASVFLDVGDQVIYSIGSGGAGGRGASPNGYNGSPGTPTIVNVIRNGQTIYSFFAAPGQGGNGGQGASATYDSPNVYALIAGTPGPNGDGYEGIATQNPKIGLPGACSANGSSCIYTFTQYVPSGAANWFGTSGIGGYQTFACSNFSTSQQENAPSSGYGVGGNGGTETASAGNGGGGFFFLVKYS